MSELERNQQIADAICRDFRWQNMQFQSGQYVVLLDGAVAAVAPNLDEALKALRTIAPDPARGMLVEVGRPMVDVIR